MDTVQAHELIHFSLAHIANVPIHVHAEESIGVPTAVTKGLAATEGHNVAANNGTRVHQSLGVGIPDSVVDRGEDAQAANIPGLNIFGACPTQAFKETPWSFPALPCPGWAPQTSQMGRAACGCVSGQRLRPHAVLRSSVMIGEN